MRVLISGASGYIGSAFVRLLVESTWHIGVLVRNVPSWLQMMDGKINIYQVDISRPMNIEVYEEYDMFIHLAAANDVDSKDAGKALEITALGTKNCLDFCIKFGIKKFIYFSTFQVYGVNNGYVNEQTSVLPINDYGITHFFAEEYVKMYQRTHQLEFVIVCPGNIYGAPLRKEIERWTLVPNCFCKEAYETGVITLKSSGNQQKDFISLQDLVNMTKLICDDFQSFKNERINVASGKSCSILFIAQLVKMVFEKRYCKECEVRVLTEFPKESYSLTIDTERINRLNYCPDNSIESWERELSKIFELLEEK